MQNCIKGEERGKKKKIKLQEETQFPSEQFSRNMQFILKASPTIRCNKNKIPI